MPCTARYDFSLVDYNALRQAALAQGRFGRWTVHIFVMAFAVVVCAFEPAWEALAAWALPTRWALTKGVIVFVSTTVIALATIEAVLRLPFLQRISFKRLSLADKSVTYDVSESGIAYKTDGMSGVFDWSTFKVMYATPTAVVLLMSSQQGVVLPARGFPSAVEFDHARRLAEEGVSQPAALAP